MAKNGYRPGDIIYLGKLENGRMTVLPVCLVTLLSISPGGELWSVRGPDSPDPYNHFIHYPDEDADDEGDHSLASAYPQNSPVSGRIKNQLLS